MRDSKWEKTTVNFGKTVVLICLVCMTSLNEAIVFPSNQDVLYCRLMYSWKLPLMQKLITCEVSVSA